MLIFVCEFIGIEIKYRIKVIRMDIILTKVNARGHVRIFNKIILF